MLASLWERVTGWVGWVRSKLPVVDHALAMIGHYNAVTYFGFLSVFPILALAFFAVGKLADVFTNSHATQNLITAINTLLPGMIGHGEGQISLAVFQSNANTVGLIGAIGLLYAGLGWLSSMRTALQVMFELPRPERPNFFIGKLRDLIVLVVVGVTMLASVGVSTAVTTFTRKIVNAFNLSDNRLTNDLFWLLGHALGIAATMALFLVVFQLLARPRVPFLSLVWAALLGAVGFEVLKSLSVVLIQHTGAEPAFQAFGFSLILLLWINYTTRVLMFSAAWAYTAPRTIEALASAYMRAPAAVIPEEEDAEADRANARSKGLRSRLARLVPLRRRRESG
jgi:membrane protein